MRCKTCGRKLYWIPEGAKRYYCCQDCEYEPVRGSAWYVFGFIVLIALAGLVVVGLGWIAIRGILQVLKI